MKKVSIMLIAFTFLIPLYAAELKTSKPAGNLTFVSSYSAADGITAGKNSSPDLYGADDEDDGEKVDKVKKKKKKKQNYIDYGAFAPFKTPLLIGAIAFSSISGILLVTGIISGGMAGYYIQLKHFADPNLSINNRSMEHVKLLGSAVYTGVAWSFLVLLFLPITVVLWVGYAFARKGEKKKSASAFLTYNRVSFNPYDFSVSIKLN